MSQTAVEPPAEKAPDEQSAASAPEPQGGFKSWAVRILTPLASLRLTVVLFALAMFLVFCGTVAQKQMGLWTAMDKYFRSGLVWIPFQLFVEFGQVFFNFPSTWRIGGSFPFPGGWLLGGLLLVNLLAAHAIRFRFSSKDLVLVPVFALSFWLLLLWEKHPNIWLLLGSLVVFTGWMAILMLLHSRRTGVLVLHLGLIIMMVSELVTGLFAVEAQMTIPEGETVNWVVVSRKFEMVLIDPSNPNHDEIVSVPDALLRKGGVIRDEALPADIEVLEYHVNSDLVELESAGDIPGPVVTEPRGQKLKLVPKPEESGAASNRMDVPLARVRFLSKDTGKPLGDYYLSMFLPIYGVAPRIQIGDRTWTADLRQKRVYKPYSIHLIKFTHQKYVGTEKPKDYSSQIRLIDPSRNENRELKISMNDPLRHAGETFYQADFLKDGRSGTVLQVVRNPGWLMPYVSCVLVTLGMLIHFGLHLATYLSRRAA